MNPVMSRDIAITIHPGIIGDILAFKQIPTRPFSQIGRICQIVDRYIWSSLPFKSTSENFPYSMDRHATSAAAEIIYCLIHVSTFVSGNIR